MKERRPIRPCGDREQKLTNALDDQLVMRRTMSPDVVTLGEVMGTLRFSGQFGVGTTVTPSLAGAEANVSIALARLGHQVQWVGSLGQDTFGEGILKTLRGENVGVDHVVMRSEPTGLLVSRRVSLETKRVDYHRSGSAGRIFSAEQVTNALAEQPKLLHVTGITPALGDIARATVTEAVREARERGIVVSFDINFRRRLWDVEAARPVLSDLARQADIVFGGTDEFEVVTGEGDPSLALEKMSGMGVREVVWKSSHLARALTADGVSAVPNDVVQAVDPIGAGDAFVAGYLSAWIEGRAVEQRLKRAHTLGGIIVGIDGDWEGLPTRRELTTLESRAQDAVRSGSVER